MTRPARSAAGTSVAELLAVVSMASVLMLMTAPAIGSAHRSLAVRGAARSVAAGFREAAAMARIRQHAVGWEVRSAPLALRLIEDGDGDGLRRDDVENGIDRPIGGWRPLGLGRPGVEAAVGCTCPSVDGTADLIPGDPGMRFGASTFVSFSARGTASSGTLYLRSTGGASVAVRVLGATGRVRTFEFLEGGAGWAER